MSNARHQRRMDNVKKIMERLLSELEHGVVTGAQGVKNGSK